MTREEVDASLPMRERGLKFLLRDELLLAEVAPHAGAWIEINPTNQQIKEKNSRSPCGSVD